MNHEMKSKAFRALGDPTRHHIVQFLSSCCCGEASVLEDGAVEGPTAGEVCCHVSGDEKINSTISHHLHELADAGLVNLEKRGKVTRCTISKPDLRELADHLLQMADGSGDSCCRGADCCSAETSVKAPACC